MTSLRSPLGKAKGLGSAKSGAAHWWAQRVTAIALIPLVMWLVTFLIMSTRSDQPMIMLLSSPFHAITLILFIGVALYHSKLGIQTIVEDYIHNSSMRITIILLVKFAVIVTLVASVVSIIIFHISHLTI